MVIIVHDVIVTVNTLITTIDLGYEHKPKAIVVAVLVAYQSAITKPTDNPYLNKVICLETRYNFEAVGLHYRNFDAATDEEAISILEIQYT